MELKLDVKTLVVGIALGVIVTAVIGAGGGNADKADFGIAVLAGTNEGYAVVRTSDNGLYIVNPQSGMATKVLQANLKANPSDRRDSNNRPFSLSSPSKAEEAPTRN
jgi:hypothetical protein